MHDPTQKTRDADAPKAEREPPGKDFSAVDAEDAADRTPMPGDDERQRELDESYFRFISAPEGL